MNDSSRDSRARVAGPAIAFLLGLFIIFLGALTAAPARAATTSRLASCPVLHLNSSGWCVKLLQQHLDDDKVSPHLAVDGHFGRRTSRSVTNFQREMKLHADGVAGPQTLRALDETPAPGGVGEPDMSGFSRFFHAVGNFVSTILQHTAPPVLAIGLVLITTIAVAALCGVRKMRVTCHKGRVELELDRFTPQRIVDSHATVLHRYIDAASSQPNQLPPADKYVRALEWEG
jgi:hypothetical protein